MVEQTFFPLTVKLAEKGLSNVQFMLLFGGIAGTALLITYLTTRNNG